MIFIFKKTTNKIVSEYSWYEYRLPQCTMTFIFTRYNRKKLNSYVNLYDVSIVNNCTSWNIQRFHWILNKCHTIVSYVFMKRWGLESYNLNFKMYSGSDLVQPFILWRRILMSTKIKWHAYSFREDKLGHLPDEWGSSTKFPFSNHVKFTRKELPCVYHQEQDMLLWIIINSKYVV